MSIFTIYKITNKLNEKPYIGFTKHNEQKRLKEHVYHATHQNKPYRLSQAIRKYGAESFTIEVLYQSQDGEYTLKTMEEYFINEYDSHRNGYNMNEGGSGSLEYTEEQKKKRSENNYWKGKDRSGELNPMFGRKHSEESKRKMSDKQKGKLSGDKHFNYGKSLSDDTKKKMSESHTGKVSPFKGMSGRFSDDSKKKMSLSKKGIPNKKLEKTYEITKPDGSLVVVKGLKRYCLDNNLSFTSMCSVANGKLKHYKNHLVKKL